MKKMFWLLSAGFLAILILVVAIQNVKGNGMYFLFSTPNPSIGVTMVGFFGFLCGFFFMQYTNEMQLEKDQMTEPFLGYSSPSSPPVSTVPAAPTKSAPAAKTSEPVANQTTQDIAPKSRPTPDDFDSDHEMLG